jgi:hypothetical protein
MTAITTGAMISDDFYATCHKAVELSGGHKTAYIHKMTYSNGIRRSTSFYVSFDRECIIGSEGSDVALLAIYRNGLCKRWFGAAG